jgi:hypothetical protein
VACLWSCRTVLPASHRNQPVSHLIYLIPPRPQVSPEPQVAGPARNCASDVRLVTALLLARAGAGASTMPDVVLLRRNQGPILRVRSLSDAQPPRLTICPPVPSEHEWRRSTFVLPPLARAARVKCPNSRGFVAADRRRILIRALARVDHGPGARAEARTLFT